MLTAAFTVRPATLDDLDWVKTMADRHRREIGFVNRAALTAAIDRGELLVSEQCGFCHYRTRKDGVAVIYEIVSESGGTGKGLLREVPLPVRLKCPVDLASNGFYRHMGGTLVAVEDGKRRRLNVWEWR